MSDDTSRDSAAPETGGDTPPTQAQHFRILEAVLFAAAEPLDLATLSARLPAGVDMSALLDEFERTYAGRGVNLVRIAGKFALRTAPDLAPYLQIEQTVTRKPSRAAVETLAVIAYHQPVTRAEIEEIRGVSLSRGTLDTLMEAGWIKPKGHRMTPGRPVTWVTSDAFLEHFGIDRIEDLPGLEDLRAAGLLDARPAVTVYSGGEALPDRDEPDEGDSDGEAAIESVEATEADRAAMPDDGQVGERR